MAPNNPSSTQDADFNGKLQVPRNAQYGIHIVSARPQAQIPGSQNISAARTVNDPNQALLSPMKLAASLRKLNLGGKSPVSPSAAVFQTPHPVTQAAPPISPPSRPMSDEEFARLLQAEEDGAAFTQYSSQPPSLSPFHAGPSSSPAPPSPRPTHLTVPLVEIPHPPTRCPGLGPRMKGTDPTMLASPVPPPEIPSPSRKPQASDHNDLASLMHHLYIDDDEILARRMQELELSPNPDYFSSDEEFARRLQEQLNNETSQFSATAGLTKQPVISPAPSGPIPTPQPQLQASPASATSFSAPFQPKIPRTASSIASRRATTDALRIHVPNSSLASEMMAVPEPPPMPSIPPKPNAGQSVPATPNETVDQEGIQAFRQWALAPRPCENCQHQIVPLQLSQKAGSNPSHYYCPTCQTSICPACMQRGCANDCSKTTDGCANFSHCSHAREYYLYRLLVYLDWFYNNERAHEKHRDQSRHRQAATPGSGVGYTAWNPYTSLLGMSPYSGYFPQTPSVQSPSTQYAENASKTRDVYLCAMLKGIAMTLRNSQERTLLPLMKMSRLDYAIAELLRNDAISDCSERDALYSAVLTTLEAIASNPHLVEFYVSPRDEIETTDGLEKIVLGRGKRTKAKPTPKKGGENETAPPLLDLMDNLAKQAEAFYKTVNKVLLNGGDAAVVTPINLCRRILETRQSLQARARTNSVQTASIIRQPFVTSASELYRRACCDVAYDDYPSSLRVPYAFAREAESVSYVNPRRTITLAKELSTMATSLPPGIFVRSEENRPDRIKALIAGPEGTPYYGGLFEFDIFAPDNYPAVPPVVQYMTTAQGRIRFNPNLYESGKVCLSLINTWHGTPEEQWQPYKSTIMQVLLSIQSMILCARPWFNEPGTGVPSDTPLSLAYDRELQYHTIVAAICNWITPQHEAGLWKDVLKMHFNHMGPSIKSSLIPWLHGDGRAVQFTPRTLPQSGGIPEEVGYPFGAVTSTIPFGLGVLGYQPLVIPPVDTRPTISRLEQSLELIKRR